MNGPTGVLIGAGKGVIRSMLCNGELKSEIIPVDIAINGLILIPYQVNSKQQRPPTIPVYNMTVDESKKRTWKWVMEVGKEFGLKYPFEIGLWYPDGNITTNKYYHWLCVVFFMWLPAYLIDFLLFIFRQRRFMVHVQTKIAVGLEVLQFFTMRNWIFKCSNFEQIYHDLDARDRVIFKINTNDVDEREYMRNGVIGGRVFVVKEPLSSLPRARAQLKCMYLLDRFCKAAMLAFVIYCLSSKLGLTQYVNSFMEYANVDVVQK